MKYKVKVKDRLFFDRWQWSARFRLDGVYNIREPHSDLDHWLQNIRVRYRWYSGGQGRSHPRQITRTEFETFQDLVEHLHPNLDRIRLMVSGNWAYVYTNDLDIIEGLHSLPYLRYWNITQAQPTLPRDTVVLRDSEHGSRTYFRDRRVTHEDHRNLKNLLLSQDDIRISPALNNWINTEFTGPLSPRVERYFFIDHDGEGLLLLVSMIRPDLIRCTIPIIKVNI